ncbi:MAG: hypothetical protein P1U42_07665 [Phycisphaerales bacterium]|nr:hypothetical protein [Phycisphaerales bacterium]
MVFQLDQLIRASRNRSFILSTLVIGGVTLCVSGCRHQSLRVYEQASVMQDESVMYFPTISAENLNREPVTLPDDLAGNPAIVLVAFKRQQQSNVNTWLDQLTMIEESIPGVRVIETPTISSFYWGWMAGFIDGGMRSGIPDQDARARTITLYTNTQKFRDALGLESNSTIYAVLLDDSGRVLRIEPGDFSQEKFDRLLDSQR